ncbi:MAG: N-acetyltransferase [Gordonia sp. (in: high G+C Gram-positive bacteria)]|uniref:GNAT family N-acetyltransferase n=1 Tax=Gordonia sp. (in: high G+C Gram-positive bacteria) TaxID=84139 RepID=UPI003C726377
MSNPGHTTVVRPERPADIASIRAVNIAAFPTADEAVLVDALRADVAAWINGLSYVAERDGVVIGHALLTRSLVDATPVLALAPCAVVPELQGTGVGTAVISALLQAARDRGAEQTVVVLGHAAYYPRFGFTPASRFGIAAPFDVPDDAFMAMTLTDEARVPTGTTIYPVAFGG